jgi:hypothetical protein
METHSDNEMFAQTATIEKRPAAKIARVSEVKGRPEYHSRPFRPKATLLFDIVPAQDAKTGRAKRVGEPSESF